MNDESTRILNENEKKATSACASEGKAKDSKSNNSTIGKAAAAAGGFVGGAAAGIGSAAFASSRGNELPVEEVIEEPAAETENQTTPSESESILATDEGVRVAQVSDEQSFAEAFADARSQVGPGGVFEWHGNAYSTYYKEEWNEMSPSERAEYQSKIDYDDVLGTDSETSGDNPSSAGDNLYHQASYTGSGYQTVVDGEGNEIQIQEVEIDGNDALLVDVDMDGNPDAIMVDVTGDGRVDVIYGDVDGDGVIDSVAADTDGDGVADVCGYDANGDGMISETEVVEASDVVECDNMPDYMNDADPGLYTI